MADSTLTQLQECDLCLATQDIHSSCPVRICPENFACHHQEADALSVDITTLILSWGTSVRKRSTELGDGTDRPL
jgi:hypothetical protein